MYPKDKQALTIINSLAFLSFSFLIYTNKNSSEIYLEVYVYDIIKGEKSHKNLRTMFT